MRELVSALSKAHSDSRSASRRFAPSENTPLDRAAFAGINTVRARLDRLKRGLRGKADVRSTSARWAWVEYVLAQGGEAEGRASFRPFTRGHVRRLPARLRRSFDSSAAKRRSLDLVLEPGR